MLGLVQARRQSTGAAQQLSTPSVRLGLVVAITGASPEGERLLDDPERLCAPADACKRLDQDSQEVRGAIRMVVPLRTGKVSAKSPGADMPLEGVSVAAMTETIG